MARDLTPFERAAIRLALLKMFSGPHFSICTVRDCLKLAGLHPDAQALDALSVLHCVEWSAMLPPMRQAVADTVLALFATPGLDLGALDIPQLHAAPENKAVGFLKRMVFRVA